MHSSRMRTVHCSGRPGEGCLPEGGVCQGVCAQGEGCVSGEGGSAQGGSKTPPDRMTDTCKNITLPQLEVYVVDSNKYLKITSTDLFSEFSIITVTPHLGSQIMTTVTPATMSCFR